VRRVSDDVADERDDGWNLDRKRPFLFSADYPV
jgi:hypothetical protein